MVTCGMQWHHRYLLYDDGGKRQAGNILGEQVPMALSHYGDGSDYRD